MFASQTNSFGKAIDASRAEDAYQASIDILTAGGHMGAAVAAASQASSRPKQQPPVQVSDRLKRAVELAARERSNGYQLTGGIRPRNRTPKEGIQALKTHRVANFPRNKLMQ